MTVRTLAEAAAEVLAKSRTSAAAEPMHKLNTAGHPAAAVHDLGGATLENPEGNSDFGSKAAAAAPSATPPGTKPDAGTKEGIKKLAGHPEDHEGHALVSPEDLNGAGVDTAGHEYMHPTMEEVEDSDEVQEEEVQAEELELTEEELEEARKAKLEMWKKHMEEKMGKSCKEDIDAMFSGEELSEEFREKASTIFEAAVIARALSVAEELEDEILSAAEESVEEIKNELEEQVDAYLNYMVEEWVNENSVAIETGLKNEIVEDFMAGLKNLFAEHYIDVPEEKVDVLEAMAEENAELEAKLNEALNKNIELAQAIVEARKAEIVNSVCEGLTATQAEKVKTLAEGVEFTTEGEYNKKIEIIRESYVSSESSKVKGTAKQIKLTEEAEPVAVASDLSPSMEAYVRAISRTLPQ